jgi:YHS domain-containing protein
MFDMFKKICMILIAVLLIFGINKLSFAMMCHGQDSQHSHQQIAQSETEHNPGRTDATTQVATKEAVTAGNKICPVSGEKINDKTKATYEYEGKIYNFCCPACIDEFKKDPDKYIKKVEEKLKGGPEAKSKEHIMMPESGIMDMHDCLSYQANSSYVSDRE